MMGRTERLNLLNASLNLLFMDNKAKARKYYRSTND